MNKRVLIIILVLLLVGGAAFALIRAKNQNRNTESSQTSSTQSNQSNNNTSIATTNGENTVAVSISNLDFPDQIKITKGGKVTWTNQDNIQHDVKSDDDSPQGGLASPLLSQGESFSFTFDKVGIYKYHCTPHPFMTGTVEVTE